MEGLYVTLLQKVYNWATISYFMNKITALENHLEFKKTSVHSLEKQKDIKRYLGSFLNSTNKPLSNFKEEDITKFINSLNFKPRTINGIKNYIKVFIKWYYADWSSRFRNLDRICKPQQTSRAYEPEQMISLDEIKTLIQGEQDLMYKVYWSVFFYGGFRPSECCRLLWNQIYFEDDGVIIKLHTTKNNKDFYKSLPKEAEHLLKEWKKFNSSEYVFPSPINSNDCIRARSVCGRLKRLSKKTLNKDVVPYALRHSIATILYKDDSRKDDDTAHQLGHNKSMKATYLNLDESSLKARARKLWIKTKPLTKDERDKLEYLEKRIVALENELFKGYAEVSANLRKKIIADLNSGKAKFNKKLQKFEFS
jgi:integrase